MEWKEKYYLSTGKKDLAALGIGDDTVDHQEDVSTYMFPEGRIYIGEDAAVVVEEDRGKPGSDYREAVRAVEKVFEEVSEDVFEEETRSEWDSII